MKESLVKVTVVKREVGMRLAMKQHDGSLKHLHMKFELGSKVAVADNMTSEAGKSIVTNATSLPLDPRSLFPEVDNLATPATLQRSVPSNMTSSSWPTTFSTLFARYARHPQ